MTGKIESGVTDCGADTIAAFAHARVGKPDHREYGQAERGDVDFDDDWNGLDAKDGRAPEAGEHICPELQVFVRQGYGLTRAVPIV
jgi:hypothetical protein